MNRARLALGLFWNNGDGTFTDLTRQVGLEGKVIFAMGSNFGDLDNDGWLDFYVGCRPVPALSSGVSYPLRSSSNSSGANWVIFAFLPKAEV